jgi:large subunit ribosomal protein L9
MSTSVILTSNVQGLGGEGDRVRVADGYARNFLIPRSLALIETSSALRMIEALKLRRAERERKELEEAQELAKRISKLHATEELQIGENGKVFGSVTNHDIADALKAKGFQVDRKAILLDEPIKKIGNFEIPIRVHPQVNAMFKLTVTSPLPPEEAEDSSRPAKKDFKAKAPRGKTTKKKE